MSIRHLLFSTDTASMVSVESLMMTDVNDDLKSKNDNNGPVSMKLPNVPDGPVVFQTGDDQYKVFLYGPVGLVNKTALTPTGVATVQSNSAMFSYENLVSLLLSLDEDQNVSIYIDTPGGDVSWMSRLISAMNRSKATITTIATGAVMSAGGPIWLAGDIKKINDAAIFMFHNSAHGDGGSSPMIKGSAIALDAYVQDLLIAPFIKAGLLTPDEKAKIDKRINVYIDAATMQDRLSRLENSDDDEVSNESFNPLNGSLSTETTLIDKLNTLKSSDIYYEVIDDSAKATTISALLNNIRNLHTFIIRMGIAKMTDPYTGCVADMTTYNDTILRTFNSCGLSKCMSLSIQNNNANFTESEFKAKAIDMLDIKDVVNYLIDINSSLDSTIETANSRMLFNTNHFDDYLEHKSMYNLVIETTKNKIVQYTNTIIDSLSVQGDAS